MDHPVGDAQPKVTNLNQQEWQPHPVIAGIFTRIFENRATHGLADVLVARVDAGGAIPWHVHPGEKETAYVLQGTGILRFREPGADDSAAPHEQAIAEGSIMTIPERWPHFVQNSGSGPLVLFAFHTPPTF